MSNRILVYALASALAAASLGAQEAAPPTLTLQDALGAAAASGDDFMIVAGGLDVAMKQRSLDLAKQGLTLGAGGAYSIAEGFGDDSAAYSQGIIRSAVLASGGSSSGSAGLSQQPQASLSLSGPQTSAALSASHSIPVPSTGASPSSVVGLIVSQKIYDGYPGGQYTAALAKSDLAYQGKQLAATQGGSAAAAKVKQAYISMLAAQRDLSIKKQVLAKQQSLLAQIQAIFAIKQATAIDLKTAQVNARGAEIDVGTADKALRLANERLAVIIGRAPGERFAVADLEDPAMPAATIDEAITMGLRKRTDVAQLDLSAKSSRIDAAVALAQAAPAVSLTGGAGLAIGWTAAPALAGAVSLGAKIALPVYDSGAAELQAKTSEGQASLYGLQAAQLRKTLASDIRDYFESAQLQLQKVALAKDSMDLADAQFELVQAQNKFGTATVQDLLTASVTAATAEVGYQTAKSAYLSAIVQLSTAMGL